MNQTKPFSHKVTQKDWQSRIGEGSRNNELFRIGRSFSAKGLPLDDVACFLGYVNEKYCDPPVEKPELEAITKSVGRYHEKTESDNLPQIEVTGDLASMVSQVLTIMATHNDPPFIFQRSGLLVRVIKDDDDYPSIQNLSIDAVKGVLARMIHFVDIKRNENGEITSITTVHPPTTVVKDLMALLELPVPTLLRITESPVYGADRTLNTTPGYHGGSRTFFHASRKFDIPPVPSKPSQKQVNGARDFLLNELVVDFPFASEADRTHAMGAMTLPLVREMIVGNTPLHLIEAPSPGTGKSLLADIITIPVTGRSAPIMTEAHHEEEWRKRLTASLSEAPTFLMIDNIRQKLDSAALSAALTTQTWSDRILGRSEVITLPVKCTWLASGNNPILTTEMARRTVRIRLDSEHSRPWQRTEFKHANLRQWTLSNRNKILWCLLIMVQNWIALGCPQSSQTLGNYEQWANVIGGILENAGFEGFLDNLDEMYDAADEETREWEEFTNLWWNEHRSNAVGIRELFFLADDFDLMLPFRGAGNENSQKTRLGRALSQNAGRKFGPFTIVKAAKRGPGSALMHHLQKDG
jgi:hypothetical protein